MKNLLKFLGVSLLFMLLFNACDKEKENDFSKLLPNEHKAKIEEIGYKFINQINPADNIELIQTLKTFDEYISIYDMESPAQAYFKTIASTIESATKKIDPSKLRAFTSINSALFKITDFYGIYTLDKISGSWKYTKATDHIEFRYSNQNVNTVIKITSSGKNSLVNIDEMTQVIIPEFTEISIINNNKEIAKLNVQALITITENSISATLVNGAYSWNVKETLTPNTASLEYKMGKAGNELLSAQLNMTGNGFSLQDNPDAVITDINAMITFMNDVRIVSKCKNLPSMIEKLATIKQTSGTKAYAIEQSAIINDYMESGISYMGNIESFANVIFQPYTSSDTPNLSTQYWEIEPVFKFKIDQSTYSIREVVNSGNNAQFFDSFSRFFEQYIGLFN